ncbi:glycosyltransferase, partial [Candidatus Parcubacteria bacterium]|nr:glycosyltransferase [Candidatus Parcubacteria bacterium]
MVNQKKIKIVHVIDSLNYGGAENQVVQLLNGLNPYRFEKHLVTFKNLETANSRALNPEIKRYIVKRRRWGHVWCIFRLYRLFKALKVDVVQAHMFQANLFVAKAARLAGVPVALTTEHGRNPWKKRIHHFIEKRIICPLVSMRVAVSRNICEVRLESGDVPEDKITVIPNCVEISEKINRYETGKRLRIGT